MGGQFVYTPDLETVKNSNIHRFADFVGQDLDELYRYSITEIEAFWENTQAFLGVRWIRPYTRVLDESKGMPWAKWFVDGQVNIEDNCIERPVDMGLGDKIALIFEGEDGNRVTTTYSELRAMVHRATALLRSFGLNKGDRVAVYGPINAELTAAMFAIARAGMVFVPVFSGFGEDAIYTRLHDADVKAVFTVDGFWHKGEAVSTLVTLLKTADRLPGLEKIVVVHRMDWPIPNEKRIVMWPEGDVAGDASLCPTDAEDPFMVIYTSGTTGRPKGAVHVHGGFLVKIAQEAAIQTDIRQGDNLMWVTDMGWIMGPWELIGAFFAGATVVSMEGSITFPWKNRLWRIIDRDRVSILGIAPTAIRMLKVLGCGQFQDLNLSSLRILASTGEPWDKDAWMWFFNRVGQSKLPIINLSGGTEVGACFLSPTPATPLIPTSLGAPSLGMAVDVFNQHGQSVTGEVGELVCKRPWPGMTRGLFKDNDKFIQTYFSSFPGVWRHGDLAKQDEHGQWFILGRSDDVIKVAGRRVGPSEVETVVATIEGVLENAAVGVPDPIKGQVVVVFVVKTPDQDPENLRNRIMAAIQRDFGKPFRPKAVHFIKELPKTRNAKVLRRLIRDAYLGQTGKLPSSLVNPDAVKNIALLGKNS